MVYIAGPFSGPTAWAVEQNVRAAEEIARNVWRASTSQEHATAAALCPHTNNRFLFGSIPEDRALPGVMEFLRRSDAVVLVRNWERSKGAVAEVALARELGLPIFGAWRGSITMSSDNAIPDWTGFIEWLHTQ